VHDGPVIAVVSGVMPGIAGVAVADTRRRGR
jgi:hypothetical protein